MNGRMKKFAEYYYECGNAEQAAISAGYSKGTAKYASQWLKNPKSPKYKPEVAEYIKQLAEIAQNDRIISARERQALLSDMAKDAENTPSDRIRAIDTLNKMTGEYTVKVDAQVKPENPFSELSTAELRKLIDDG